MSLGINLCQHFAPILFDEALLNALDILSQVDGPEITENLKILLSSKASNKRIALVEVYSSENQKKEYLSK